MTESEPDGAPVADPAATHATARRNRRRAIPAFAVAAMLVAGGLLMTVGGMVRLAGPAPPALPTPKPTAARSPSPTPSPVVPATAPLGPTASPRGVIAPRTSPV